MRDQDIAISGHLLRRLRAAADLLELPNAEAVAELWLSERLQQMPEVEQLITEQSKSSAKIRAEWKAKQQSVEKRHQIVVDAESARLIGKYIASSK